MNRSNHEVLASKSFNGMRSSKVLTGNTPRFS